MLNCDLCSDWRSIDCLSTARDWVPSVAFCVCLSFINTGPRSVSYCVYSLSTLGLVLFQNASFLHQHWASSCFISCLFFINTGPRSVSDWVCSLSTLGLVLFKTVSVLYILIRAIQFSSVIVANGVYALENADICLPSHLLDVLPTLPKKQSQCSSEWRWLFLVLSTTKSSNAFSFGQSIN